VFRTVFLHDKVGSGRASKNVCARAFDLRLRAVPVAFMCTLVFGTAFSQNLSFGSQDAKPVPPWLSGSSVYELWLNAFSVEGNLRGALPGLQRIADLGAAIVYLGPIARRSANPKASPYSIADYNAIDPEAGTDQDLRDFVAAAHRLHLKVMLDIVYYHTAPDNIMMQKDPSFFVKTGDGKIARGFWPQPLPDFSKPEVRKYLVDSLVHWVRDFGIDGFRCDVGGGIPESSGPKPERCSTKSLLRSCCYPSPTGPTINSKLLISATTFIIISRSAQCCEMELRRSPCERAGKPCTLLCPKEPGCCTSATATIGRGPYCSSERRVRWQLRFSTLL
jgi:hypothetical protein